MPLRLLLRSLFRRRRVEQDLDDELSFHMAMDASVHAGNGVPEAEARRRARRSLGGFAQVKEACRDTFRMGWLDALARDVHYALRSFRRQHAVRQADRKDLVRADRWIWGRAVSNVI